MFREVGDLGGCHVGEWPADHGNVDLDRVRRNLTMLFIAHDLSVVEYLGDQIQVMYLSRLMEVGRASEVHSRAMQPYTRAPPWRVRRR
ncbi:hypothetical protein [Halomonas sp.]|uniref:hypothetical protein n=1 Tax=Halomonas sp. TaxID=1486246 RepID=UPI0035630F8E